MTYTEIGKIIEGNALVSGADGGYTAWNEELHIINSYEALSIINITNNTGIGLNSCNIEGIEICEDRISIDTPYGNMTIYRKKQDAAPMTADSINSYLEGNAAIENKDGDWRCWNNRLTIQDNGGNVLILMIDEANINAMIRMKDISGIEITKDRLSLRSSYFKAALTRA